MSFGSRLRELRSSKKITQLQLAKMLNLSKANVSKYEADLIEPNIKTLTMITELFNVTADYLLGISDVRNSGERGLSEKEEKVLELTGKLTDEDITKLMEYGELLRKANR